MKAVWSIPHPTHKPSIFRLFLTQTVGPFITLFFWLAAALLYLCAEVFFILPLKILAPLSNPLKEAHLKAVDTFPSLTARVTFLLQPWFYIDSQIKLPQDRPALIIANHRSILDVFLILASSLKLKVIAKSALFKVPLLGFGMKRTGQIRINKNDTSSYLQAMKAGEDALRAGHSVLAFPEGTRAQANQLGTLPFQLAPFAMAKKAGAIIVPVSIEGTERVWPKSQLGMDPLNAIHLQSHSWIDSNDFETAAANSEMLRKV